MILRSLLFFALSTGCIAAATITTQVECNGVVFNASACSDSQTSARVTIGATGQYLDSVGLYIAADGAAFPFPPPFVTFSATATFQDDYLFTVTGGSGAGMIEPCIAVTWDNDRGIGSAGINFGSAGFSTDGGGGTRVGALASCDGFSTSSLPFTFGVPQIVTVSMSATAQIGITPSEVDDSATLDGFQFFDDSGNQLSNVHFSLVSTSVPEPGMWFPLLAVFLLLSAWEYRGSRERGIGRQCFMSKGYRPILYQTPPLSLPPKRSFAPAPGTRVFLRQERRRTIVSSRGKILQ